MFLASLPARRWSTPPPCAAMPRPHTRTTGGGGGSSGTMQHASRAGRAERSGPLVWARQGCAGGPATLLDRTACSGKTCLLAAARQVSQRRQRSASPDLRADHASMPLLSCATNAHINPRRSISTKIWLLEADPHSSIPTQHPFLYLFALLQATVVSDMASEPATTMLSEKNEQKASTNASASAIGAFSSGNVP